MINQTTLILKEFELLGGLITSIHFINNNSFEKNNMNNNNFNIYKILYNHDREN